MYPTSVVDNSIYFCNINCYETVSPAKIIKYPDMSFLKSTSPSIHAFVYLSRIDLSFSKHRLKLEVHLRYLNIHLIFFFNISLMEKFDVRQKSQNSHDGTKKPK